MKISALLAHTCLMMGEVSLETSPKNNIIQDMINSDHMNSTESTIPNIFKIIVTYCAFEKLTKNILLDSFAVRFVLHFQKKEPNF